LRYEVPAEAIVPIKQQDFVHLAGGRQYSRRAAGRDRCPAL